MVTRKHKPTVKLPKVGDDSPEAMGKRMRYAREEQGLSIKQVAAKAGVTPEEIEAFERGEFDATDFRNCVKAGKQLREYRESQGLTIEQLAAKLKKTPEDIKELESGNSNPKTIPIEMLYDYPKSLSVDSPPEKLRREIGKRIDYAIKCRGIPRHHIANALGLKIVDLVAFSKGESEPTGHQGLALSMLLRVDHEWLALGGMTPTLTAKRIDEIIYKGDKKPATMRELLLLSKTLKTSPFDIQWGSKKDNEPSPPRKRRKSAA